MCGGWPKEPSHWDGSFEYTQHMFVLRNKKNNLGQCMRFPTMWYVRPAKPQISLCIRTVWSEPLLVAWVFYDCEATDWTPFGVSKLKMRLQRLVQTTHVKMPHGWKSHALAQFQLIWRPEFPYLIRYIIHCPLFYIMGESIKWSLSLRFLFGRSLFCPLITLLLGRSLLVVFGILGSRWILSNLLHSGPWHRDCHLAVQKIKINCIILYTVVS